MLITVATASNVPATLIINSQTYTYWFCFLPGHCFYSVLDFSSERIRFFLIFVCKADSFLLILIKYQSCSSDMAASLQRLILVLRFCCFFDLSH